MKSKMIISIVGSALVFVLWGFTNMRYHSTSIKNVRVNILDSVEYITKDEVMKDLMTKELLNTKGSKKNNELLIIENELSTNPYVEEGNCFFNPEGELIINIKQYMPVARIKSSDYTFYLSSKGTQIPLSKHYSAPVPLIVGNFSEEELKDVNKFLNFLSHDSELSETFSGMYKGDKNQFYLKNKGNNMVIKIGDLNNLREKFDKYFAFINYLEKVKLNQDTYSRLNLSINGQIIAIQ